MNTGHEIEIVPGCIAQDTELVVPKFLDVLNSNIPYCHNKHKCELSQEKHGIGAHPYKPLCQLEIHLRAAHLLQFSAVGLSHQ